MLEPPHGGERPSPLEATGERLVPEAAAGELVLAEHLARYRMAARLAPGRRVLDAACGEGYGSVLLREARAASVIGVDVDARTVEHARSAHGIDAREADVAALPFDDGAFDLVVSFETIEHVAEPERTLDEFTRVLAPSGVLIISTPNPDEYLEENPFHRREFTGAEMVELLAARFAHVIPLHQQNFLTSAILDADRLARDDGVAPLGLDATKVAGTEPGRELYSIAVCGDRALPALAGDVAVLAAVYEAHEMASTIRAARRERSAWEERTTVAEHAQQAWEGRAVAAEAAQRETEQARRDWQARATEAERQNDELRATVETIWSSVSWRVTKPLRRLRSERRR